jgi:hypothetical protein
MSMSGSEMKITHAKLSRLAPSGRSKRLVTICAELGGPNEFMTITVAVPNDGADQDIRERGIARALDYARQFSEISPQGFPSDMGLPVPISPTWAVRQQEPAKDPELFPHQRIRGAQR